MTEARIDSEDKNMLVSTTSTIYPGMIEGVPKLQQVLLACSIWAAGR